MRSGGSSTVSDHFLLLSEGDLPEAADTSERRSSHSGASTSSVQSPFSRLLDESSSSPVPVPPLLPSLRSLQGRTSNHERSSALVAPSLPAYSQPTSAGLPSTSKGSGKGVLFLP